MGKRQLGIGRNLRKRQKTEDASSSEKKDASGSKENTDTAQEEYITVPLEEEADPEDPTSQLCALWKTWLDSDRDSELLLNGIINECDRLVRLADKASKANKGSTVDSKPEVYAIFGMSLAELAKFHTEDTTAGNTVKDYFDNAVERIELGEARKPENGIIRLAHASVDLSRIPLEYISKMDLNSTGKAFPDIEKLLDKALEEYLSGYKSIKADKEQGKAFKQRWILEIFDTLDDLIDIVRSFGEDHNEQIDSDEEEELEEGEARIHGKKAVGKRHPLYKLIVEIEKDDNKYGAFFEEQLSNFLKATSASEKASAADKELQQGAESKFGLWLLAKAARPTRIYSELEFGEEKTDEKAKQKEKQARSEGIKILEEAIEHLKVAWNEEIPSTWVDLAEAKISLGNMYEESSKEQDKLYEEAAKYLRKANNATHGKYQEILDSLVDGAESD